MDGTFSIENDEGISTTHKHHRETWERLMLDRIRREYIRKFDELALSGRPLSDIDRVPEVPRAEQSSMAIAKFLRENDVSNHQEPIPTLSMSKAYSLLLQNFLNKVNNEVAETPRAVDDSVKQSSPDGERYMCYLYPRTYARKSSLTEHVSSLHTAVEARFSQPFPCPKCLHDTGLTVIVHAGTPSWSRHIHNHHDDPRNTPSCGTKRAADHLCPHCPLGFSSSALLTRHERARHGRVRSPRKRKQVSTSIPLPASSPSLSPDLNVLGDPGFTVVNNTNAIAIDPDLPDFSRPTDSLMI